MFSRVAYKSCQEGAIVAAIETSLAVDNRLVSRLESCSMGVGRRKSGITAQLCSISGQRNQVTVFNLVQSMDGGSHNTELLTLRGNIIFALELATDSPVQERVRLVSNPAISADTPQARAWSSHPPV
jgi:hypothetical protein